MDLPPYQPPCDRHASVAVGLAPLFLLATFAALVIRWMDFDTAVAIALACTVWVGYEMTMYQRRLDTYNRHYVDRYLRWRSSEALLRWAGQSGTSEPTRDFIHRFVANGRELQLDGPGH
jgi:hypothetical protein